MDRQQRLRDLALERRGILYSQLPIDLERRDQIEQEYAALIVAIEQDRLVKTR